MAFIKDQTNSEALLQSRFPIKIDHLVKSYGKIKVLDDISLSLKDHECLGIVGPNGAGKTTLLQCLMGLVKIQKGNIRIFGYDVVIHGKILSVLRNIRPRIGYTPEQLEIYPFLTIDEYTNFLGDLYGLSEEALSTYTSFLFDIFELETWQETLVKNLSRGNHQKLMICTALIHQPEVLILDEPFATLDVNIRNKVKKLLNEFITDGIPELGINSPGSILISSHSPSYLEDLCTHMTILHSGKIAWKGSISDAKKRMIKDQTFESFILEVWNRET
ncbi:MAG: ABC transporter ATP-binding protein [Promethearchaeota archaeon]